MVQLAFLLRSERYRRLAKRPSIRSRTDFFDAAATVTRVFAYGGATPFLCGLSEALEAANIARAGLIDRGLLYASGTIEANTIDFVHYEQCIVQCALERLYDSNPAIYGEQIKHANAAIAVALESSSHCAWGSWAVFARAALHCRAILGRCIEFADQEHRETLGVEIARSHRVLRPID